THRLNIHGEVVLQFPPSYKRKRERNSRRHGVAVVDISGNKRKNIGIRSHVRLMAKDQIFVLAVLQGKNKAFESIITLHSMGKSRNDIYVARKKSIRV